MSNITFESASAYLLGELADDDAQRVEAQILAHDDTHEALGALEDSLIDAYVGGRLPPERRERFEARYLNDPKWRQRIDTARARLTPSAGKPAAAAEPPANSPSPVTRRTDGASTRPAWDQPAGWTSSIVPLLVIVGLIAAFVAVFAPNAPRTNPTAATYDPIKLAPVQGVQAQPHRVQLPTGQGFLAFELAFGDKPPTRDRWTARLLKDGKSTWNSRADRVSDVAAQVKIPISSLSKRGLYTIEIWGGQVDRDTLQAAYKIEVVPSVNRR